ncbi:MAG: hypothetical protein ACJARX_001597 [Psychroserpens sp.]|jgi:hypothetical protein|uniref:right-handed parallel beta-helix repeat-containing protein n=1 Tax=Psychroserpens sp. TaxID=2020870 RepID=UPI0039E36266
MKKHVLKIIIGVPLLLLVIALALSAQDNKSPVLGQEFNAYLKPLPSDYEGALRLAKTDDLNFFTSIINNYSIRELLIFKVFPDDNDVKTDFIVDLYPTDKKHLKGDSEFISFTIINDAVLFNNGNKTYGVFKLSLPLINIEKLVIKNKIKRKIDQPWESVLTSPFEKLLKLEISQDLQWNEVQKKPMIFSSLFTQQLGKYDIKYLPSHLAEKDNQLSRFYKAVDDFMSSEKITFVNIGRPNVFWKKFNVRDITLLEELEFVGDKSDAVKEIFSNYIKGEEFKTVFNSEKLAYYNALKPVFVEDCARQESYFLYNPETSVLEPFHTISNCPKEKIYAYLKPSKIEDDNYLQSYILALEYVSQIDLFETFIKDNLPFKNEVVLINDYDPSHVFDFDILRANQRVISKSLNPSSALKSELISITKTKMTLSVFNTSNYTIDILELNHNNNKTITSLSPRVQVRSNQKDTITIDLPRSFENLFVSKKKKIIGFVLPKHIYALFIKYRFTGLDITHSSSIIPYQKNDTVEDDLFRTEAYINNHRYIVIDKKQKEITFSKDSVVISSPLVIPKNYTFKLNPGVIINIVIGGKIISHSPLSFIGTAEKPIKIYSSDKKGQGLLVLSEQKKSILKHVVFDHLRNPTHGSWGVTGAVTFYESPVDLQFVAVKNNACEDALNIVRAKFTMDQVSISNTQSDGFDGDYVQGTISNCQFDNLGNDAIDVSGSDLIITNVVISNAGDKGLSAGENSKMSIDTIEISDSEIAIAGKDLSIINAKNLKILNTKLGFTAFQKKPEFGPSTITVTGILMTGIETKYLIESSSSMFVDNEKIETTQNVKDRMYGVEFGISSAETRNTPQQ